MVEDRDQMFEGFVDRMTGSKVIESHVKIHAPMIGYGARYATELQKMFSQRNIGDQMLWLFCA